MFPCSSCHSRGPVLSWEGGRRGPASSPQGTRLLPSGPRMEMCAGIPTPNSTSHRSLPTTNRKVPPPPPAPPFPPTTSTPPTPSTAPAPSLVVPPEVPAGTGGTHTLTTRQLCSLLRLCLSRRKRALSSCKDCSRHRALARQAGRGGSNHNEVPGREAPLAPTHLLQGQDI